MFYLNVATFGDCELDCKSWYVTQLRIDELAIIGMIFLLKDVYGVLGYNKNHTRSLFLPMKREKKILVSILEIIFSA